MPIKKTFRRYAKKAGRYLKKRYFKGKGYRRPNIYRMYRDVNTLRSLINAEKKKYEVSSSVDDVGVSAVAAFRGNTSGHNIFGIRPDPNKGTNNNQRVGNSIRWCSSHLHFRFSQQDNAINPVTVNIYVIREVGKPSSNIGNLVGDFFEPNKFIQNLNTGNPVIYDNSCPRQQEHFKNFRIVAFRRVYLPMDSVGGSEYFKDVKIGLKWKKGNHLKFQDDGTLTCNQHFILMTANTGNKDDTFDTTLNGNGMAPGNTLSGARFLYNFSHYYIDN